MSNTPTQSPAETRAEQGLTVPTNIAWEAETIRIIKERPDDYTRLLQAQCDLASGRDIGVLALIVADRFGRTQAADLLQSVTSAQKRVEAVSPLFYRPDGSIITMPIPFGWISSIPEYVPAIAENLKGYSEDQLHRLEERIVAGCTPEVICQIGKYMARKGLHTLGVNLILRTRSSGINALVGLLDDARMPEVSLEAAIKGIGEFPDTSSAVQKRLMDALLMAYRATSSVKIARAAYNALITMIRANRLGEFEEDLKKIPAAHTVPAVRGDPYLSLRNIEFTESKPAQGAQMAGNLLDRLGAEGKDTPQILDLNACFVAIRIFRVAGDAKGLNHLEPLLKYPSMQMSLIVVWSVTGYSKQAFEILASIASGEAKRPYRDDAMKRLRLFPSEKRREYYKSCIESGTDSAIRAWAVGQIDPRKEAGREIIFNAAAGSDPKVAVAAINKLDFPQFMARKAELCALFSIVAKSNDKALVKAVTDCIDVLMNDVTRDRRIYPLKRAERRQKLEERKELEPILKELAANADPEVRKKAHECLGKAFAYWPSSWLHMRQARQAEREIQKQKNPKGEVPHQPEN